MKMRFLPITICVTSLARIPFAFAQHEDRRQDTAPIYRVTVVERTAKAINYQYRSGSTKIDFRGTVLLPHAKGEATVESRQGGTEIDAKFEGLETPQHFGLAYLTYVLWAITPEGRPHNIGELIADPSNKARIRTTTDLQAFALIVTAEPYSAVRQPSDVVTLENEVRPDTLGTIKPVEAKYELLPRGEYTVTITNRPDPGLANTPGVSMHEYNALLELYQARNALAIAGTANAERYAPDTLARARQLLDEAQQLHDHRVDFRRVVEHAREAAQTAEDARVIAQRREQAEQLQAANRELSKARAQASNAEQQRVKAVEEVKQIQARADATREQAEAAVSAQRQAESEAAAARERAQAAQAQAQVNNRRAPRDQQERDLARKNESQKNESRLRLLQDLRDVLPTLDTGRGVVATVPDDAFRGAVLRDSYSSQLTRIAAVISSRPSLHVSVEGYSDSETKEALSRQRAEAVRRLLIENGVASAGISAAGFGDRRPLGSNATPQGRKENSRVEIVISGDEIGALPLWGPGYTLTGAAADPDFARHSQRSQPQ